MTTPVDYHWHLRRLMAERGLFNTTALRPLLALRGVNLSASQVYRLVAEKPERLSIVTLIALVDILGCTMEDLIDVIPAKRGASRQVAGSKEHRGSSRANEIGTHRPVRAKIIDTVD